MKLVIVESPTKAKTLGKFLPKEYDVVASMGHVRDLPKSKLGVDVENNFEPVYEISKGKGTLVKELKRRSKGASEIILAMDPDREGEAIAYHLKELLSSNAKGKMKNGKFSRVSFHEITKSAIEAALAKPHSVDMTLVDAQQARRVVDRLVGYQLSPLLWRKVRRGLSAGRVQSVAVRLIVEREKEIGKFVAQEYWFIAAELAKRQATSDKRQAFTTELVEIGGKRVVVKGSEQDKGEGITYLDSKEVVTPVVEDLKKAAYLVSKVERKERKSNPYPPFTTSTMQQAGANVLGWSGKKTMKMAQDLYEAGLITYHRTDSFNLASEAVSKVRGHIETHFGKEYLPETPKFYATKAKSAQEAHEAIRPTHVERGDLKEANNGLTPTHEKLYRLIWRRFVACQMNPAVYDQTTILVSAKGKKEYSLKATGSIMKFEGWRKAYGLNSKLHISNDKQISNNQTPIIKQDSNSNTQSTTQTDVELPEVGEGEGLDCKDVVAEQKATQPPPRFNDASLIKELERLGIGRPSTYAPIISTIIDRGYIEREERRFKPTAVGDTVTKFLKLHFKEIMDYSFTAEMEEDLDRIARGEKEWRKVMKVFYSPFAKTVKKVEKDGKRIAVPVEETGEICPECKTGKLVIRSGRFGKFISCSTFPECKYTANIVKKLENFKCPECGGEVVLKRTKKGRTFWGCANYPKCEYASWKDPRQEKKG